MQQNNLLEKAMIQILQKNESLLFYFEKLKGWIHFCLRTALSNRKDAINTIPAGLLPHPSLLWRPFFRYSEPTFFMAYHFPLRNKRHTILGPSIPHRFLPTIP